MSTGVFLFSGRFNQVVVRSFLPTFMGCSPVRTPQPKRRDLSRQVDIIPFGGRLNRRKLRLSGLNLKRGMGRSPRKNLSDSWGSFGCPMVGNARPSTMDGLPHPAWRSSQRRLVRQNATYASKRLHFVSDMQRMCYILDLHVTLRPVFCNIRCNCSGDLEQETYCNCWCFEANATK